MGLFGMFGLWVNNCLPKGAQINYHWVLALVCNVVFRIGRTLASVHAPGAQLLWNSLSHNGKVF